MGGEDEEEMIEASEYLLFVKDIFMNERVVASKATLQAIEPIIVQFLEHPVFKRPNLLEEVHVIVEVMDVLGFATFYIPVITKEFWDAFRIVFTLFQRVEADSCRG